MSRYSNVQYPSVNENTFNNHPIIPNANEYFYEKKYISIHSEDRDPLRFPNSSEFEIELPQDYLNVASVRLYSWSFPANYNVFSIINYNVILTFKFDKLYDPTEYIFVDPNEKLLAQGIYMILTNFIQDEYILYIETGFYNPEQMAIELTNKMNESVTNKIRSFLDTTTDPFFEEIKLLFTNYDRFKVVYNSVAQKLWFGNQADIFILTNDSNLYLTREVIDTACVRRNVLPEENNWGLPFFLGFTRCPQKSITLNDVVDKVPRFYYGDVANLGDNGYWLTPVLPGATVSVLEAPFKINFMGSSYIYLDIEGLNCIDETSPYNVSKFTVQTNKTNGIVNSSFAKIPVPTTPISQWFDTDMSPYKYFNPPAERIRKLNIRLRYHNNMTLEFGLFEYSFMLEFNILRPQQDRSYSIRGAFDLAQIQTKTKTK